MRVFFLKHMPKLKHYVTKSPTTKTIILYYYLELEGQGNKSYHNIGIYCVIITRNFNSNKNHNF